MQKVKYPLKLDVESFCEAKLRKSISARRMKDKEARDKEMGLESLKTTDKKAKVSHEGDGNSTKMDVEEDVEPAGIIAISNRVHATQLTLSVILATTGFYQLIGVVTHKV